MKYFLLFLLLEVLPTSTESADYKTFNLVTYNTGLTPSNAVAGYSHRLEVLKTTLAKFTGGDVLCLQEVWRQQDILDILNAARSMFPYYHTQVSGNPGDRLNPTVTPCSLSPLLHGLACLNTSCYNELQISIAYATPCAFNKCAAQINALTQECLTCMFQLDAAGVPSSQLANVMVTKCSLDSAHNYVSTHGLMMLSKYPLTNKRRHSYHLELLFPVTRGYLSAEIAGLGTAVCTHLTTAIGASYFGPPQFSSFLEFQGNEVDQLLTAFPANSTPTSILMGDFNTGPEVPQHNVSAVFVANYYTIINASYESPYVNDIGRCTVCSDNPISVLRNSEIVDNIFISKHRNFTVTNVEQIWTDMNLTGNGPLSDHSAAIRLTLRVLQEPSALSTSPSALPTSPFALSTSPPTKQPPLSTSAPTVSSSVRVSVGVLLPLVCLVLHIIAVNH